MNAIFTIFNKKKGPHDLFCMLEQSHHWISKFQFHLRDINNLDFPSILHLLLLTNFFKNEN